MRPQEAAEWGRWFCFCRDIQVGCCGPQIIVSSVSLLVAQQSDSLESSKANRHNWLILSPSLRLSLAFFSISLVHRGRKGFFFTPQFLEAHAESSLTDIKLHKHTFPHTPVHMMIHSHMIWGYTVILLHTSAHVYVLDTSLLTHGVYTASGIATH